MKRNVQHLQQQWASRCAGDVNFSDVPIAAKLTGTKLVKETRIKRKDAFIRVSSISVIETDESLIFQSFFFALSEKPYQVTSISENSNSSIFDIPEV